MTQNLLEEIICDADTYNLGTKKFKKTNNQIFEEWKIMHPGLKRKDFDASTIVLLEQHEYYTNYCKAILQHTKKMTLDKLKKKQSESKNNTRDEDKGETEIDKKAEELHWLKTWFRLPIVKPGSVNQCRMLPGKPILYTFNLT